MKFTRFIAVRKEIIVIPDYKVVRKGTLIGILKQVNLSIEKLRELI